MPPLKKIIVLGCGLVGEAIAIDLCREYNVTVTDINPTQLQEVQKNHPLKIKQTDLSVKENITESIKDFDLVIGAVPGFMGFNTLKTVIESGKNIVDISFFAEDPFELEEIAKKNNVTAVFDCGVAPGMSSVILGYHNKRMKIDSFECYVGGLPLHPKPPFKYKAPFSPTDVIEEYVRPARIVENGKVVVKEALSEPELIELEKAGELEAFNTDGLRSLIKTMQIKNMKEKTLRYPGHIELMKVFRETGFFRNDEIFINNNKIKPVDLTTKLLFPFWRLEKNEREFTVVKVILRGESKEIIYNMYDEYDEGTKTSSMARTTGYTCTAVARILLNGMFESKGIIPPENIGQDENYFNFIMESLASKNIIYNKTVVPLI